MSYVQFLERDHARDIIITDVFKKAHETGELISIQKSKYDDLIPVLSGIVDGTSPQHTLTEEKEDTKESVVDYTLLNAHTDFNAALSHIDRNRDIGEGGMLYNEEVVNALISIWDHTPKPVLDKLKKTIFSEGYLFSTIANPATFEVLWYLYIPRYDTRIYLENGNREWL